MKRTNDRNVVLDAVWACVAKYQYIDRIRDLCICESGRFHNTVFQVTTDGATFFLKVLTTHPDESTESRYEYIADVMGQAAGLGIDVPMPIRNDDGFLLTPCGDWSAVASKGVGGEPFRRGSLQHQHAAGRFLGAWHRAMAEYHPRGTCWIGKLGSFFASDASLYESLPDTAQGEVLREHQDQLTSRFQRIESEMGQAGYSRLARAVIHSEYVAKHVRMGERGVVSLLDFEYVSRDVRAMDIALALEDFPCSSRGRMDFIRDRTQAFLAGYSLSGSPLTVAEINAIPVLLRAWYADSLGYWIRRLARTGQAITLFDVRQRVNEDTQYIDSWRSRAPEFVAMLLEVVFDGFKE